MLCNNFNEAIVQHNAIVLFLYRLNLQATKLIIVTSATKGDGDNHPS